MNAEQAAADAVGHNLGHPGQFAHRLRLAETPLIEPTCADGMAFLDGVLFGHADASDLRHGEHGPGNDRFVQWCTFQAEGVIHRQPRLGRGGVRQGQSAVDVAYRIQASQAGLHEAIRHDFASRAEFDARFLQAHAMGVGTPADRDQNALGTGYDLVVCKGDHAIRNGHQAFHCAFVDELDSAPAHFTLDDGSDIAVDEGQGTLAHGDERDLYAKRIHDERILARHDTIPDDKQKSGSRVPMQQIVAGHHAGTVSHEIFGQYRARPCTNQYGVGLDHAMARHLHAMSVQNTAPPLYVNHAAVRHQAVDAGIEQV